MNRSTKVLLVMDVVESVRLMEQDEDDFYGGGNNWCSMQSAFCSCMVDVLLKAWVTG